MRNVFYTIVSVLICTACSSIKTEKIQGDLHFSFIRLGSFYNVNDTLVNQFKVYMDTAKVMDEKTQDLKVLYETLKTKKLLYSPFIQLKTSKTTTVNLYLDSVNYEQFKAFDLKELVETNSKIVVQAEVLPLGKKAYQLEKMIDVYKTDGRTTKYSRKLKIENYK